MNARKIVLALALAGLASGAVHASPYTGAFNTGSTTPTDLLPRDGTILGVSGFDVFSNGSVAIYKNGVQLSPTGGTLVTGDQITTYYQGVVNVINPGKLTPNLKFPGQPGNYQITVAAKFVEDVVFAAPGLALLQVETGGEIAMFYDAAVDSDCPTCSGTFISTTADILAGVGYTDGVELAHGFVRSDLSLTTLVTTNGTTTNGSANIAGLFDFVKLGDTSNNTNGTVGFNPIPHDFASSTTLQFGPDVATDYRTVGFFDNANGFSRFTGTVPGSLDPNLTMRGDANVDLSAIPEPATVALLGIALAGLGASRRRRAA